MIDLGGFGIVSWKNTIREMKTIRFYKDAVCEGLLTLIFMTFVTMSSFATDSKVFVGSLVGFSVMALVEAYGHINFALFNPNLVIGLVLSQRLSIPKGILFIAVEMGVSTGAAKMIYEFTPPAKRVGFAPPGPGELEDWQTWVCEFIAVLLFVSVLQGATDGRRKTVRIPNLAIGFTVAAAGTIGGPYGVCLNPIVSFGLSAAANSWGKTWIYWSAGPVGAIAATIFYYIFAYDEGGCGKLDTNDDADSIELAKGNINAAFDADELRRPISTVSHNL